MNRTMNYAIFPLFTLLLLSSVCLNDASGSSSYGYEGEATVIDRSQIPNLKMYVKNVSDPKRDSYERVLRVDVITSSSGHGADLKVNEVLFVQSTNDASKRAVVQWSSNFGHNYRFFFCHFPFVGGWGQIAQN